MFPWTRPPPHPDFHRDAAILLKELLDDIAQGKPITFEHREIWSGGWSRRGQERGLHKQALVGSSAKLAKCVWCERVRDVSRELDVEHYRPKGGVTRWEGRPHYEIPEPPKEVVVHAMGYAWLAFSWPNLSLSCKTCNQGWKRNLFPVENRDPTLVQGVELTESPLLIEPGSLFQTVDHFAWDDTGIIQPKSERGYATIVTCGLNRSELLVERRKVLVDAIECLEKLISAMHRDDGAEVNKQLTLLGRLGDRGAAFTSMVRSFAEQYLRDPWDSFPHLPI